MGDKINIIENEKCLLTIDGMMAKVDKVFKET